MIDPSKSKNNGLTVLYGAAGQSHDVIYPYRKRMSKKLALEANMHDCWVSLVIP